MRQQIKCSKKQIADYWTQSGRLGADYESVSALYENECFACRYTSNGLERAHILADCLGGLPTKDNLHLLCRRCHLQSEMLDGETYWRWILFRRSRPRTDPLRERIETLRRDFGIDVFGEMQIAVNQCFTLADFSSQVCRSTLMPAIENVPDTPMTEQDRSQALETINFFRNWFKAGEEA